MKPSLSEIVARKRQEEQVAQVLGRRHCRGCGREVNKIREDAECLACAGRRRVRERREQP